MQFRLLTKCRGGAILRAEKSSWAGESDMKLAMLRGDYCPDGRTCAAVHQTETGSLMIVGRAVTDEDALSQMAIGPGEIAVEVPAALLPEVSGCVGC